MSMEDAELDVLQNIYSHAEHVPQRDLAKVSGLSLGMTNAIVKRLVAKGWLAIRKVNNRNIRYAVSPTGIEQISKRSYRFFKRTIRNIAYYREAIEAFIRGLKGLGFQEVVVVGASDLDFIVQHFCTVVGIGYTTSDAAFEKARSQSQVATGCFLLYSESYIPDKEEKERLHNVAFLREVIDVQSPLSHPPRVGNQTPLHERK